MARLPFSPALGRRSDYPTGTSGAGSTVALLGVTNSLLSNEVSKLLAGTVDVALFPESSISSFIRGDSKAELLVVASDVWRGPAGPDLVKLGAQGRALLLLLFDKGEAQALWSLSRGKGCLPLQLASAPVLAEQIRCLVEFQAGFQERAATDQARWRFAFEGSSLGVWELSVEEDTMRCSAALCRMVGRGEFESVVTTAEWSMWCHPHDRERVAKERELLRQGTSGQVEIEYRVVAADERVVWVRETSRALVKENGRARIVMGVVADTTSQRTSERRLVQLVNYDALTELPNRKKCLEVLGDTIGRVRSTGQAGCLFRVDISGLTEMNQDWGRVAGDEVLQEVASRLRAVAPDPERVFRLGGKEFAVIMERLERSTLRAEAARQARDMAERLSDTYLAFGESVTCAVHIGACEIVSDADGPDQLLRKADIALAEAAHGDEGYAIFRPTMLALVEGRKRLLNELRRAAYSDELGLAYQPIVNGRGTVVGVEALARWQHPTHGKFPASEFIPLAESSGMIVPLGASLRRQACEQLARWSGIQGTSHLVMSLNVSPQEFHSESFVRDLVLLVESMKIDPSRIRLELSETLLGGQQDVLVTKMQSLHSAGIRLSLDDFGTGYSSLTLLKRLPFDQLKLDRSFVKDILTDPVDASLSRAILALAQNLALEVVAEGVEEDSQVKLLAEMGCSQFQGYLFGRPTDALTIENRCTARETYSTVFSHTRVISAPPSEAFEDDLDAALLIVDDDPTTLQLLTRILREYPNIQATTSPLEAVQMAQAQVPDLLLLDTQMPELDGFELWETLRASPTMRDVPAVFVTALLDPETELRALSMGAVDFVSKPISAARLKVAVRNQVRIKRQTDSLREQASIDPLTLVANRRSFDRALEREVERALEGKSECSLLMIDVDHFKSINDSFGHPAGDRCLMSVARVLTCVVQRSVDLIARYGGEEFGVILPLAGEDHARRVAQEIVDEIAATDFDEDLGEERQVTASVGWATLDGSQTTLSSAREAGKNLVEHADQALLHAKETGRNRACGPWDIAWRVKEAR